MHDVSSKSPFAVPLETYKDLYCTFSRPPSDLVDPGDAEWNAPPRRWPYWSDIRDAVFKVTNGLHPPVPDWLAEGVIVAICNRVGWFLQTGVLQPRTQFRQHSRPLVRFSKSLLDTTKHLQGLSTWDLVFLEHELLRQVGGGVWCGLLAPTREALPETLAHQVGRDALSRWIETLSQAAKIASKGRGGRPPNANNLRLLSEVLACSWAALTGRLPGIGRNRGSLLILIEDVVRVIERESRSICSGVSVAFGASVASTIRPMVNEYRR